MEETGQADERNLLTLSQAYLALGLFSRGIAVLHESLQLDPDCAEAYLTLGICHQGLSQEEEALQAFQAAIDRAPSMAQAHYKLGALLHVQGRFDEALDRYNRALALDPSHAKACFNRTQIHLLKGNFAEGWPGYELRLEEIPKSLRRRIPQALWRGEFPVSGKRILLHAEQGLGDTVFFLRYARLLSTEGARLVIEVQTPLRDLIEAQDPTWTVLSKGEPLPDFDLHCPMGSIPLAFLSGILRPLPRESPYLNVPLRAKEAWSKRLGTSRRMRVGLAWAGNPLKVRDSERSIPLPLFKALLQDFPQCEFFCLQKEIPGREQAELAGCQDMQRMDLELRDFSDTAALVHAMDLVICVDTSLAHVAAAMGKEVWILLPYVPDWRWGLARSESDWYPSARLFRQEKRGDWPSVISRVRIALGARV